MTNSNTLEVTRIEAPPLSAGNNTSLENLDRIGLLQQSQNVGDNLRPSANSATPSALSFDGDIYGSEQPSNSRNLINEPQLIADVRIHSGAPGQVAGHQSIEVTNNIIGRMNFSFATDNAVAPSFGRGTVYFDEEGLRGPVERTYRLTPQQDRAVLEFINERRSDWDGSRYSLTNRNCRTFVREIEDFVRTLPQRR